MRYNYVNRRNFTGRHVR